MSVVRWFKNLALDRKVILLLVLLGFALYANSFGNRMFWDDSDWIVNNQFIHNWQYFPNYFSENVIAGAGLVSNYWRPVLLFLFSIEWHLWGSWAPGYHIVNTAFHITDAILLFFILSKLFGNRTLSALTSIIFLAHPLQTEAVTYVNSLGDSLSVFFMFLGIRSYQKHAADYSLLPTLYSLIFYALALMSKETAIIMPALIFVVDFFSREAKTFSRKLVSALKRVWPLLVTAALYILLRATVLNFSNTFNLYNSENAFTSSILVRIFTFFHALTIYIGLLFRPVGLHMERILPFEASLFSLPVMIGGALFFGLIAVALVAYKKDPVITFGILWFFIGLAPTSNIAVPINGLIYEHWLYLPLIGIGIALISAGMRLLKHYRIEKVALTVFIIYLGFFSYQTIARNREWRDPITFYKQTLSYSPNDYRIVNNLGMAYADAGDTSSAEVMYTHATEIDPSVAVAYHNLGNLYLSRGDYDRARTEFKTALAKDPKFFFSSNALLNLELRTGHLDEAKRLITDSLKQSGARPDLLTVLAEIEASEKDFTSARLHLEEALALDPQNPLIQVGIQQIDQELRTRTLSP